MEHIRFDFTESGVEEEKLFSFARGLEEYCSRIEQIVERGDFLAPEASLNISSDALTLQMVENAIQKYKKKDLKYIVIVGIGGSNLGTMAIYQALFGTFDAFKKDRIPKILFLDTVSEEKTRAIVEILEKEAEDDQEFVINVVSKSGKTTETIANFEVLYKELSKQFGNISERVVVTTDVGSPLWDRAKKHGFTRLSTKKNVGGRFSVFSAVGLFPLGLTGVSIRELLEGACAMREKCFNVNVKENPSMASAIILHTQYMKGITIHNSFFFAPELENVGKWYRQLVGESLGKRYDVDGNEVFAGITPIVSIGSTALHSMAQLYFGGPHDKFTTIITIGERKNTLTLPESLMFEGIIEGIQGKDVREIMHAISLSVQKTYKDLELSFATVEIPDISAFYLGQYLQYKMMEVMFLAQLMKVNAFDQPSVQKYKSATRDI
ncbi:MAG: hypothetical protein KAS07_03560, partial [Candidatus Pacebacteria bacterium]|nr:hypothetical protein [Candidatus Paceibacterota bacterium]